MTPTVIFYIQHKISVLVWWQFFEPAGEDATLDESDFPGYTTYEKRIDRGILNRFLALHIPLPDEAVYIYNVHTLVEADERVLFQLLNSNNFEYFVISIVFGDFIILLDPAIDSSSETNRYEQSQLACLNQHPYINWILGKRILELFITTLCIYSSGRSNQTGSEFGARVIADNFESR